MAEQSVKNYITPGGAEKLRQELHQLLNVERPKVVETVSWAASNGDRSENGDYIYGKKRLREIDSRVRFLNKRLDAVVVVDPETQKGEQVLFGATVVVETEDGQEQTYQVVGIDETVPEKRRVSWISPIGKALLNRRVGDVIEVKVPKGSIELEVKEIRYESIR